MTVPRQYKFPLLSLRPNGRRRNQTRGNGPLLTNGVSLLKNSMIYILAAISFAATTTASAKPKRTHDYQHRMISAAIVCDERLCLSQVNATRPKTHQVLDPNGNGVVVGHRPSGCPHAFCGCEASLYLFGAIRPDLNLASNWIRRFPRTSPAPGMAAVRNHHVMVLMNHVDGSNWLVHDGNSGGGLTRDHVQSISRYIIVDPRGSRYARQLQ